MIGVREDPPVFYKPLVARRRSLGPPRLLQLIRLPQVHRESDILAYVGGRKTRLTPTRVAS
jgi:hypothetical protein